jgi:hypothetical protein
VLTQLGVEGKIVRGRNGGHWRTARPQWTAMESWLCPDGGSVPEPAKEREGYAELVRRWLVTFGPGTEADLVWWLGSTKGAVRAALADVGAVEVGLDSGSIGWLMPDDTEADDEVDPWAALLPVLDPTVMGWKERDWYLGEHAAALFDRNGNAGPTVWWNGRVVGGWAGRKDGEIAFRLLEDVGTDAVRAIGAQAEQLQSWLGEMKVTPRFATPLAKELSNR